MGRYQMRKPYPFVHEIKDRHGHLRACLRKPGCPSVALPLPIGSRAFVEAYQNALEAEPQKIVGRTKPGSMGALVDLYYRSRKWSELAPESQRSYRFILEPFVREHGERLVRQMEAKHVETIMASKSATPVQANRLRKLLSQMMKIAILHGWRRDNPVVAVDNFKIKSKGHRGWSDDEVAQFEAHHPIGTEARLAFALLLHTGQRVSDAVRMGTPARQGRHDLHHHRENRRGGLHADQSRPRRSPR
jgi:integrase